MKLTDKRFWRGTKRVYYPSFIYALTDSLLFSVLWTLAICLMLFSICLFIQMNNGDAISGQVITFGLVSILIVFFVSNGMFLYDNWLKQCYVMRKTKELLPDSCVILNTKYDDINKQYQIMLEYSGKQFVVTVNFPLFYISKKGTRALGALNINSRKFFVKNKSAIVNYMS